MTCDFCGRNPEKHLTVDSPIALHLWNTQHPQDEQRTRLHYCDEACTYLGGLDAGKRSSPAPQLLTIAELASLMRCSHWAVDDQGVAVEVSAPDPHCFVCLARIALRHARQ